MEGERQTEWKTREKQKNKERGRLKQWTREGEEQKKRCHLILNKHAQKNKSSQLKSMRANSHDYAKDIIVVQFSPLVYQHVCVRAVIKPVSL